MWTDKYLHEDHAYDKNNAGYANAGSLPQQIWCSCKLRKCVGEQLCANVQSLVTKQPFFLKTKLDRKGNIQHFWLHSVITFAKFEQYNKAFQGLLSEIIREAVARRSSLENLFLEIPQNSQESTCSRVPFLIKLQACATLLKRRFWSNRRNFSCKLLYLQQNNALLLGRNQSFNYPYILSVYMKGKAGFSLRIPNRNLVLMLHIFQQSGNKIIK